MMALPEFGNRNTVLTIWATALPVICWGMRGFFANDWTGLEWVVGTVGLVSGASAYRARGEYQMRATESSHGKAD